MKLKKIFYSIFSPDINSVKMCKLTLKLHKKGFRLLSILARNRLISKYGIHLGFNSKLGHGLKFPHPQGIVIGKNVEVGDNCTIYQNVTLGTKHSVKDSTIEYPIVGKNVTIYTGAIIIGGVDIGDNSIIGANSLVLKDVDPNSVYSGSPARKMKSL